MSLMTKMRDNMAGIFAAFAAIFIIYVVLDWGMDITGRKQQQRGSDVIGSVEGTEIHYQQFSELVRQRVDALRQQTGKDVDAAQEAQVREEVWNMLVNRVLIESQADRLGIKVTDQEIVDWVKGPNPPDYLVRLFTDSTGKFNRAAYDQALSNPQFKNEWVQIEQDLRLMRLQQKLESSLTASHIVTEGEVRQAFIDRNTQLRADYVFFTPAQLFDDASVKVTDDDLRRYYDDHVADYKQEATRRLKIVTFPEVPSAQDTADALTEANKVLTQSKSGADFLELAKTYSEAPVSEVYQNIGSMSQAKQKALANAKNGDIVGPFSDYDGYHVVKLLDRRDGKDEYIRASHILFQLGGPDSEAVKKEARDVRAQLRSGANFAELAKKYSKDPGSAQNGGDLGWFGKGRMVKPFEEAAFRGKVGELIRPVRTPFGLHIIKVTGRSRSEFKIADIDLPVILSSQTRQAISQRASDFAYIARKGDFDKEARGLGLQVRETPPFTKKGVIPGIGVHLEISRIAFDEKEGFVTDPISIRGATVVCKITEVKNEGVKPFDEVKEQVRSAVLFKKKMERAADYARQIRQRLGSGTDLAAVPTFDSRLRTDSTGTITPMSAVEGITGRDQRFVGALMTAAPGAVTNPIRGDRGYYIAKLLSRTPFDEAAYTAQKTSLRDQLLQGGRSMFISKWLENVREKADIVDDRDKFFRE